MPELFNRILWKDWRVKLVLWSVGLAVTVTLTFYIFVPQATDASHFLGAAFASWISGLLLFLLVGSVVAIVSLARPEQELFDARARNLLRRQEGSHIDYIIGRFHNLLEAYVASSEKRILVLDFDEAENKFYTSQTTVNALQCYLDDQEVSIASSVAYENASSPPKGRPKPCLTYLKVDGDHVGDSEEFEIKIKRDFNAKVPANKPCIVEHRFLYWIKAGEEANRHRPIRYTKRMVVVVENQLANRSIVAILKSIDGLEARITIPAGSTETIVNLSEIAPRDTIYDFYLDAA
ncbi:hypothetical protein GOC90_25490 [Sinorhizobium medicae]|uniref:hypothetical protein n=1 Tax=Sinorhizobium medicae TaxID=110321 RepID=UPI000C795EC3|nr:hypothetical protein [Sinorhizobium medicae]MDX0610780.1 hypothetical protein [Sinorhizobium medicae]MDX0647795.1 hypothetical protein [Sinorhizobium medicae]MDX0760396.1 hypothetical protein [Sinorhizobium medicae]MDX0797114.1 hypothetical protein [Sinorhizobium medicae]MDX1110125.1 hypothetical protein [Sinorhizobium medicae]